MKTALILIDIQNDYFENGKMELSQPEKASENAAMLLARFREQNSPVIHIQHKSGPDGDFFIPETSGVEIHKSVTPTEGETHIVKNYPNGFRHTNLLQTLKDLEIEHLVICGMMTHMCVDATTRAAKDFDFECTLIGDACATRDLEINGKQVAAKDVQTAFLAALDYFYAKVINTEKYLKH
ncbi:cysteine hydrolase family protein [Leeuwenhoekiella sp. NPDC079379]|uniref:cysteine hydrolase family protein n=1 Tax=Leeuwenhoekiella sp. NPDC079379 TaxID=3364122 RepID=UPI0037C6A277